MLQVGISQEDRQPSALGLTGGPELSVLVPLVHGKDGGREGIRNGPPLDLFLHTLKEQGRPRLPFWSIGKEIKRGWSWDLGSVTFIRPFPLSLL